MQPKKAEFFRRRKVINFFGKFPFRPNRLNNLSIMERNIRYFDKANVESLDDEELELRQWYRSEVNKNVKFMESTGFRFSSDDGRALQRCGLRN